MQRHLCRAIAGSVAGAIGSVVLVATVGHAPWTILLGASIGAAFALSGVNCDDSDELMTAGAFGVFYLSHAGNGSSGHGREVATAKGSSRTAVQLPSVTVIVGSSAWTRPGNSNRQSRSTVGTMSSPTIKCGKCGDRHVPIVDPGAASLL